MAAKKNVNQIQVLFLEAHKELRVEIHNPSDYVCVELLSGTAEIFGVEMLQNKLRTFTSSFAVFTWLGCSLKLEGHATQIRRASQNNIINDIHKRLQDDRMKAHENGTRGPVVIVAGPVDVGKSTLTRCLLNYACRSGWHPLFVDLDVGQSSTSIPGTLSLLSVDSPGDIVKGYDDSKLSVYYFGYKAPMFNMLLYFLIMDKLSKTLSYRMQSCSKTRDSGAIIDTCGWVTGRGYDIICHAAKLFCINTLLVIDDRNLYSNLKSDLPRSVDVVYIDRLDGVVARNKTVRMRRRNDLVHEYFHGTESSLTPYLFNVKFSEISIVKITCSPDKFSREMLNEPDDHICINKVSLCPELVNQVLGISYCDTIDNNIISTSVHGFVCVKEIDMENRILTLLSPKPEPLPNKILILGDIIYEKS